jgi:hypothetical protein
MIKQLKETLISKEKEFSSLNEENKINKTTANNQIK